MTKTAEQLAVDLLESLDDYPFPTLLEQEAAAMLRAQAAEIKELAEDMANAACDIDSAGNTFQEQLHAAIDAMVAERNKLAAQVKDHEYSCQVAEELLHQEKQKVKVLREALEKIHTLSEHDSYLIARKALKETSND